MLQACVQGGETSLNWAQWICHEIGNDISPNLRSMGCLLQMAPFLIHMLRIQVLLNFSWGSNILGLKIFFGSKIFISTFNSKTN